MRIQDLKMGIRLSAAFTLIIVVVTIMKLVIAGYLMEISDLTTKLYNHPFTVSTTMQRIDANIIRIHRSMKDVALSKNSIELNNAVNTVNRLEQKILDDFTIAIAHFLGDKNDLRTLRTQFVNWKTIRDEVIELKYLNEDAKAAEITKKTGAKYVHSLTENIESFVLFAHNKAVTFKQKVTDAQSDAHSIIYITMVITLVVALLLAIIITRSVTRPLNSVVSIANKIVLGDLTNRIEIESNDEIGTLTNAFRNMQDAMREKSAVAKQIADGDLDAEITVRSEYDELGSALNTMTQSLREMTEETRKEDWLKTGQTELSETIRGELSASELTEAALTYLCKYMNLQVGTCYLESNDSKSFKLLSSYAYKIRNSNDTEFEIGEGFVGQAALEKKNILFANPTDEESNIIIDTGMGEFIPRAIFVMPLVHDDTVGAVLEFGSEHPFSENELQLFDRVSENIAVALHSARSRVRMQELLEQTKEQQEKLAEANTELEEQTEKLKASEEELRQQSEELRVSNEELEEKQELLERKNIDVELAKEDIEVKAEELRLASKYKSEFLANMSHELRTPLNSLLILSKSLMDNKNEHLDDDEVEDAKIIHEGGSDLLHLINDIMDLSKVEAGMLSVISEEVSLTTITHNLNKMFEHVAVNNGISYETEIADDLPPTVKSDGLRLEQILKNFLSNSMKFTRDGSVKLKISAVDDTVRFTHSDLTKENAIAFTVVDTGIGIPKDKQKAIFEAFQQQDGSTSRNYGGTGLGLTISRELSFLLGGEIQLKSEEGVGSSFTLYLPLELDKSRVTNQQARIQATDNSTLVSEPAVEAMAPAHCTSQFISDDRNDLHDNDMSLLIIDDDKNFAKILYKHCKEDGFKCLVAGDGRSGLMLAKEYKPNAILLDLGLPDISGHDVIEQLKFSLDTRHIPVQVISGREKDLSDSFIQSAIGYLTKPVDESELTKALDNIRGIIDTDVKSILIVEDDANSRHAITKVIDHEGVDITCVETGQEGIDELMANEYNCVVLDLGLPDMSGFDLLDRVCGEENIPPVIIYTGRDITDDEYAKLNKYSSDIVIKGENSADRLLDDVSLFLHTVESKLPIAGKKSLRMLHNEDAMLDGRRVLLVDDDMRNTYALSKKLMELGLEVEMANNGQECIEILEKDDSYELILMDIMMPIMDGYEATRKIRQMPKYKDVPVIALTAKAMPDDRRKCIDAGASEYLTKPIDFDRLLSLVRVWLFKRM